MVQSVRAEAHPTIPLIEIHNSGSRLRKRCRFAFVMGEVQGWIPRKRSKALFLGSALDEALKAYYHEGSRQQFYEEHGYFNEGEWAFPDPEYQYVKGLEALDLYFEKEAKVDIEDDVTEEWDALRELALAMWERYVKAAPRMDRNIQVVMMSRRFTGRVGTYLDPTDGTVTDIMYGGEMDGIFLIDGKLYIDENKTSSMMDQFVASLDRDEQASRYNWALVKMVLGGAFEHLGIARDTPVAGSFFNILNKKSTTPVRINQNGTISKQALNNTIEDYCLALTEHRGYQWAEGGKIPGGTKKFSPVAVRREPWAESVSPPSDTNQVLIQPFVRTKDTTKEERDALVQEWDEQHVPALLRLREIDWHRRVLIDRNPASLAITEQQLYWEGVEEIELRKHPERGFRNPTFQCAIMCSFLEPCTASLRGEPIQSLLEEFYINRFAEGGFNNVELTADDVPELIDTENLGW